MADTTKQTNELRVKCTLRQGSAQTTRTLTVSNPKPYNETERQRMIAFRDKLINGSLSGVVQPASWRDSDEDYEPYETAEVEFSTFTSTEVFRDLNAEPEPLQVSFTPATLSGHRFVEGDNEPVTINVEGTGNFEIGEYSVWGADSTQNVEFDGLSFRIVNDPQGGLTNVTSAEGTATVAVVEVVDASTGRKGTGTLIGDNWTPRVQII